MAHDYVNHPVHDRLYFAERRLSDLRALNKGDLGGALPRERQLLLQEFFFHLCGAIDFLAQEVNNLRKLGLGEEEVSVGSVCKKLEEENPTDIIKPLLAQLHPLTRNKHLPVDPYSEGGSHFRILLFRNFVSHIRHSPWSINVHVGRVPARSTTHLFLDPRLTSAPKDQRTLSNRETLEELALFLDLVKLKCDSVLNVLGIPVS